jgi:hypothetical protein
MAVEYRTESHATPLVILPSMGIIYLKDDTRGYQMTSQFLKNINVQMDLVVACGGSVLFKPYSQGESRMVLWLLNSGGHSYASISAAEDEWDDMCDALLKIQRFVRAVLWRTRKPSHNLKKVKAFLATDTAESIPVEILSKIVTACFADPISNTYTLGP